MVEFPHYRINGVEAHGVIQKVGSELGLAGLVAWGAFTGGLFVVVVRRRRNHAWVGVLVCLHVNLLTSTEAFTMTHWIPLGLAWMMSKQERP